MTVPMVRIGKVRMDVCQRAVPVQMMVLGAGRYRSFVLVLVVFVMDMFVIVPAVYVIMFVFMTLGQMQPCAQRHQSAGDQQRRGRRLSHNQSEQGAEERRNREVSARACSAKVAQANHE